jgi:hypothetical protein
MSGYTKLFSDIVSSTIWQEPNDCRVLWITMLAMKGKDHICRATIPALAKLANITLADCEGYLEHFTKPDKYSRSQENEGRRIEKIDGGFLILNGEKYRKLLSKDERREQVRLAVQRYRKKEKEKALPGDSQDCDGNKLRENGRGNPRETLYDHDGEQ